MNRAPGSMQHSRTAGCFPYLLLFDAPYFLTLPVLSALTNVFPSAWNTGTLLCTPRCKCYFLEEAFAVTSTIAPSRLDASTVFS